MILGNIAAIQIDSRTSQIVPQLLLLRRSPAGKAWGLEHRGYIPGGSI